MMLSRWQHMLFLTSVLLKERPASTYPSKRHHCENLRTWLEAEAPPRTTETRDSIRTVRGMVHSDHIVPPQDGTSPHWEGFLGLWFLWWKKRAEGGHPAPLALWLASPEAHSGLASWGLDGIRLDHQRLGWLQRRGMGFTAIKAIYDKPELTSYSVMKAWKLFT